MASIATDTNGNRTIQFIGADGKRRSVRLGKIPKKLAESVKVRIETLCAAIVTQTPLDNDTSYWVANIGDDLASKLAAVGLIPERRSAKLGEFLHAYLERRRVEAKPNTLSNITHVVNDLLALHNPAMDLRAYTPDDAERFKNAYLQRNLAPATIYRRIKVAKMLFGSAIKQKHIRENPFADVKTPNRQNIERRQYISEADTEKLLAVANPTWRVVIALSRYAGLRCPSEVCLLRWEHIDFATNRMTVSSPKTECHAGKEYRVVPIFTRLRPYLDEAFELAEAGAEYVVDGPSGARWRASAEHGWKGTNLRTTMLKLIRRAGLTPWPKPFHNLRASCETDLMQHHPIHVVTAWIGNTPNVALGHYLQTLESDFAKAVGNGRVIGPPIGAQGSAECGAIPSQSAVQKPVQTVTVKNRQHKTEKTESDHGIEDMSRTDEFRHTLSQGDSVQIYPSQDSNLERHVRSVE